MSDRLDDTIDRQPSVHGATMKERVRAITAHLNAVRRDWKRALMFSSLAAIAIYATYMVIGLLIAHSIPILHPQPSPWVSMGSVGPECETIHLATICGGYRSSRDFYTLLKSILAHRVGYKIHYHLFVDSISSKILHNLFETWPVPHLTIGYYNVTNYESDVAWIPNLHYSNRYGLLKLMLPSILAKNKVSKVILLDTDMIVLGDIKLVWEKFSILGRTSFLALVENQSDWYQGKAHDWSTRKSIVWPAVGRGYNTGLMLIDTARATTKYNWEEIWRDVAESELVDLLSTSLADQDIYNAVIKKHNHIVTKLPCHFNIQLNNQTDPTDTCLDYQAQDINIVHWNTPQKLKTSNNLADYFKGFYLAFQNWNGKLLERDGCPRREGPRRKWPTEKFTKPCDNFHPNLEDKLRTFLFFTDFEIDAPAPKGDDVSLVVHLSLDRIQALEDIAEHWPGPISAAIYLNEAETSSLVDSLERSPFLSVRKNIAVHLAYAIPGWHYPINRLRNLALQNSVTPYVFLTDVDFVPSPDLYPNLKEEIKGLAMSENDDPLAKRALVVPAFEFREYRFDYPETKGDLLDQLDQGRISEFRKDIWPEGQRQTDYNQWRRATQPYKVRWADKYEPFIVTSRNVSRFDERFIGFGWNKVQHLMSLAAQGYEFLVLPSAFMIHQEHTASRDIKWFRRNRAFHKCIQDLNLEFAFDLVKLFPEFESTLRKHLSLSHAPSLYRS